MSLATTFPISPLFWPTVCSLACDSVCLCVPLIVDLICFCCLWRRPTCPAARKTHPPDHCSPGPWLPSTPLKTNCRTGQEKQKSSPCAPNESDSTKRCHLASWNEHSPRIVVVFHKKNMPKFWLLGSTAIKGPIFNINIVYTWPNIYEKYFKPASRCKNVWNLRTKEMPGIFTLIHLQC